MAKVQPWWQITKTDENAFKLDVHFQGAGQPRRLLLLTDLHWDSAHCELPRLKAVLDESKALGAPVFSFGDTWDAMQGKWDPRSSTDAMRPEFQGGNYLDLLVTEFTKWFQPWKENLALITYGNHETSILKRHQVDLLQRAVGDLRRDGSPVLAGPYVGFVVVANRFPGKHLAPPIKVHFHHGAGGGAEVTRGFIDHNRTRSMYSDFDCHISGHIHRRNMDENIITRVTSQGKVQKRRQLFLRSSCWKDESTSGWHVQQGRAARPIGGWWLELIPSKGHVGNYMVDMRPIPT